MVKKKHMAYSELCCVPLPYLETPLLGFRNWWK